MGCGALTREGKDMLFQLGVHLRGKYNSTLQPYKYYDPDRFASTSTNFPRTIQSANELIRGLFEHLKGTAESAVPSISTLPHRLDTELLVWTGWPAVRLFMVLNAGLFNTAMNAETLKILSPEVLRAIGHEVGILELCDSGSTAYSPFFCALNAQDVCNCRLSEGTAETLPTTRKFFPQLTRVLEEYNAFSMWRYDEMTTGGRFIRDVGTLGYVLALSIIDAIKENRTVFRHFSGHDTTLMPLWMTLGNYSLLNPPFGAAMVFEVFSDPHFNGSTVFVSVKIGSPGQLPGNHNYTFENYTLHCMTHTGALYASGRGCPLEDLERYVRSRGPTSSAGICYVEPKWKDLMNCTPGRDGAALSELCIYYRTNCRDACGPRHGMMGDLSCVPISNE
jgi:hypothetical protein